MVRKQKKPGGLGRGLEAILEDNRFAESGEGQSLLDLVNGNAPARTGSDVGRADPRRVPAKDELPCAPVAEGIVPATEETPIAAEETVPAAEEAASGVNEAPAAEEAVSGVNGAPAAEKIAPPKKPRPQIELPPHYVRRSSTTPYSRHRWENEPLPAYEEDEELAAVPAPGNFRENTGGRIRIGGSTQNHNG